MTSFTKREKWMLGVTMVALAPWAALGVAYTSAVASSATSEAVRQRADMIFGSPEWQAHVVRTQNAKLSSIEALPSAIYSQTRSTLYIDLGAFKTWGSAEADQLADMLGQWQSLPLCPKSSCRDLSSEHAKWIVWSVQQTMDHLAERLQYNGPIAFDQRHRIESMLLDMLDVPVPQLQHHAIQSVMDAGLGRRPDGYAKLLALAGGNGKRGSTTARMAVMIINGERSLASAATR
jgi:hypothetical protein